MIIKSAFSQEFNGWKDITENIGRSGFITLKIINEDILVSTENSVFLRKEGDGGWKELFFINGTEKIVAVAGFEGKTFIATKHRVYAGDPDKKNFVEIFSININDEITAIDISSSKGVLWVGSNMGLWKIPIPHGSRKEYIAELKHIIYLKAHPFESETLFIGTDNGLYKLSKKGLSLLYSTLDPLFSRINSISISKSNDDIIYVATDGGLIRIRLKSREFRELKLNGKILCVETLTENLESILALGEREIFISPDGLEKWNAHPAGIPSGVPITISKGKSDTIYLLTSTGIYQSSKEPEKVSEKDIEKLFSNEPSIEELERAALKSYMIDRKLIQRWRRNSRLKALLPEVNISVDSSFDRDFDLDTKDTIYTSSSSGRYYIGPDERKLSEGYGRNISYGIKLSWKVGDALFNSSELSISNEAEDIMDFKYRVLSELRRVYFERRRLIAEMYLTPIPDNYKRFEIKNRIDELTTTLDMMSDGYFSKSLRNPEGN